MIINHFSDLCPSFKVGDTNKQKMASSMTSGFFVIAALAIVITGVSKSGFGGGLGAMAVPLMSLFVAPQLAAAVMMPLLVVMDAVIIWRYRKTWSANLIRTMLPGALIGLVLGALLFQSVDATWVKLAVGIMAVAMALQFALKQGASVPATSGRLQVLGLGALSGFSSFVAHAGGPPVKGYLLQQGFEKSTFVGTNTVFFCTLNALKFVAYVGLGHLSAESLQISAVLSPMLAVGIGIGFWLHGKVDQRKFTHIVNVLLFAAGVRLIWDGAQGLMM